MHLLDRLHASGVRGQVTSASTGVSDTMIKVFNQSDNTLFQNYVGHHNGMYHIVLNPGEYRLEIHTEAGLVSEKVVTVKDKLIELNIEI